MLAHRPEEGTSLKNGRKSERLVALSDPVCEVLDDWLLVNHPGVVDGYDREPLFATKIDRLSRTRGRTIVYQYTRPCIYADNCPTVGISIIVTRHLPSGHMRVLPR